MATRPPDPERPRRGWCRRRRGTTSATSSSSTSRADPRRPRRCCQTGLEPFGEPGRCAAVFVDWQSRSEDGDELTDPVRAQYKEAYIVISGAAGRRARLLLLVHLGRPGLRDGARLDPGLPEEARRGVDDPHVPDPVGGGARRCSPARAFGATCTPAGVSSPARGYSSSRVETGSVHTDPPIVNVRYFPRLSAGDHERPAVHELVRAGQPRPRGVGDLGGRRGARAVRRAGRGTHAAGARCRCARVPLHVRLHVDDLMTVKELGR